MPLPMTITEAGLDALVNAEQGETEPLIITQVDLSMAAVDAAPTLEELPAEFKRINAVSGQSVAANIIHLTAQDSSADIYELRSIALYLDDGTLFAAYGQEDPIFTKVSIAAFLLALDLAFSGDIAGDLTFGDASFLYPPASETVKGVAEIATQTEVNEGEDDERIVTALKLATRLAPILLAISDEATARGLADSALQSAITNEVTARGLADSALQTAITNEETARGNGDTTLQSSITTLTARTIAGGGLATGGGSLAANRTITVTAATGAEIAAGTESGKAITPAGLKAVEQSASQHIGIGGSIIKLGSASASQPGTTTFPIAFPTACDRVLITPLGNPNGGDEHDETWWGSSISATGFAITTDGDGNTTNYAWVAFGR